MMRVVQWAASNERGAGILPPEDTRANITALWFRRLATLRSDGQSVWPSFQLKPNPRSLTPSEAFWGRGKRDRGTKLLR